jgi:hypothetical protein
MGCVFITAVPIIKLFAWGALRGIVEDRCYEGRRAEACVDGAGLKVFWFDRNSVYRDQGSASSFSWPPFTELSPLLMNTHLCTSLAVREQPGG